jgi:hypothetical protein
MLLQEVGRAADWLPEFDEPELDIPITKILSAWLPPVEKNQ